MNLLGGREPVALGAFIRLALLAAISFGLTLTDTQLISLMAAIEAGLGLMTRQSVVTPATLLSVGTSKAAVNEAIATKTDLVVTGTGDGGLGRLASRID